jgi:hypothetical protein
MAAPHDADIVLAAVRLGWFVAEVRGRNAPFLPRVPAPVPPDRAGHALPLRPERTVSEQRIEAQAVLAALTSRLEVGTIGWGWRDYPGLLDSKAKRLAEAVGGRGPDAVGGDRAVSARWDALAELIYQFDAHIQDVLTARSDSQACGYLLGRALAECYWALDPRVTGAAPPAAAGAAATERSAGTSPPAPAARPLATPPPDSWRFLLGPQRCQEISRLLGRLSAYMHEYTAPAMAAGLEIWRSLAEGLGPGQAAPGGAAAWWQAPQQALYQQTRRWYELVILRQDPTTLIKPYALLGRWRLFRQAAKLFGSELLFSAVGAGALAGLAVALSQPQVRTWLSPILGVLALTGFSAATLSARLKNKAQALVKRVRQDAYTDLLAVSITICPPPPPGQGRRQRRLVSGALRRRSLTAATPN